MAEKTISMTNIIGEGTQIEGKVVVPGSIRIDGNVDGELTVSELLTVGTKGYVKGQIHTRDAIVAGEIKGDIVVNNKIELQKNAKVNMNLTCKLLVIEEGVVFDGTCTMSKSSQHKAESEKPQAK